MASRLSNQTLQLDSFLCCFCPMYSASVMDKDYALKCCLPTDKRVLLHSLLLWTSLCGSSPWVFAGENGQRCIFMLFLCPLLLSKKFFLLLGFLCLSFCFLFVSLFRHEFIYLVRNGKLR